MTSAKLIFCAGIASLSLSACANHMQTAEAAISHGNPLAGLEGVREAQIPIPALENRLIGDFGGAANRG